MLPDRNTPALFLLTGCTAAGKTGAALAWAERFGAEIVSCDSLLFYRGMDIGTAKPTREERARVPHHLIDMVEPDERMDVKTYARLAADAVREIEARGRRALVVGGSGFYLRSFLFPVADDVAVDPAVREELEQQLAANGLTALVQRLESLNPAGLGALDTRNPRRVVRALERCLAAGASLNEMQERFSAQRAPFDGRDIRVVEIAREPEDLRVRIAARTREMIAAGLIDEVARLRAGGFEKNPSAARAIGYRETLAWLARNDGRADTRMLADEIALNTWKLVRKQRTWFRTQLPPHKVVSVAESESVDVESLFD